MYGSWRQCTNERGIASVMAIFIMVMMLVAGIFLVRMSSTEGEIAYGSVSAEGSFFAADAGINVGVARVDLAPAPRRRRRAVRGHRGDRQLHVLAGSGRRSLTRTAS